MGEPSGTADTCKKTTWWLWNRTHSYRVVIEAHTVVTSDGFRVDTPVYYFCEYDGHAASGDDSIMITNEEFAKQRAEGAIRPLSPEFGLQGGRQEDSISSGESTPE